MSFQPGFMGAPTTTPTDNLDDQQRRMTNMITSGMESCLAKSIMSGTAGFALGGVFGLFMSSMAYDTPMSPQGAALTSLPMKEQLRRGFKDMGSRSWSSAKNFGRIGAIFSICECTVEGFRAKNDLWNSAAGGGLAGVWLARSAGPQAMVLGGGGFAAFSTAIDWYMRQPESD